MSSRVHRIENGPVLACDPFDNTTTHGSAKSRVKEVKEKLLGEVLAQRIKKNRKLELENLQLNKRRIEDYE